MLVGVVLLGIGAAWLGRTVSGFSESAATHRTLEERFGAPSSYTPPADGAIAAPRMEAFLSVRQRISPQRDALSATLRTLLGQLSKGKQLEGLPLREQIGAAIRMGKSATAMGTQMGEFFRARNDAMLAEQIGPGEYAYIYTLAYQGRLVHPEEVGPRPEGEDADPEFRTMGRQVAARVHADLVEILKNQLEAAAGSPAAWREALAREIAAMETDGTRIPWQDALPGPIRAALEPYRSRLESTYDPATHPFELARTKQRGRWSYQAD